MKLRGVAFRFNLLSGRILEHATSLLDQTPANDRTPFLFIHTESTNLERTYDCSSVGSADCLNLRPTVSTIE